MKITQSHKQFVTFFRQSSTLIKLLIVVAIILIVTGTSTVAAMLVGSSKQESLSYVDNNEEVASGQTETTTDTGSGSIDNDNEEVSEDTTAVREEDLNDTPDSTPVTSGNNSQDKPQETEEKPDPEPVYVDTYPSTWKNPPINSTVDSWGMSNRQSVSYTAWKADEAFGNMPFWGGQGDAKDWPTRAESDNIPTGKTPKKHSVAITTATSGPSGFSAWVEAVNGNKITVSHYNWGNTGKYGLWEDVPASTFETYIYFGD